MLEVDSTKAITAAAHLFRSKLRQGTQILGSFPPINHLGLLFLQ